MKIESTAIIENGAIIGDNCYIGHFTLIRKGAIIGANTQIRSHCYIGEDVRIGENVMIRPFSDICKSTVIEDDVFIAMNCITSNTRKIAYLRDYDDENTPIRICRGVRIGVGVTILPGVVIGENCLIGGGSLVTKNTQAYGRYFGHPATYQGDIMEDEII